MDLSIDPEIPAALVGDAARLRQVLSNLLGNAIKFTNRGSVHFAVTSEPLNDGTLHRIAFRVTDTGIGIDPARLESIFDQFEQAETSTTRRFGGTGLGLAIARHLVCLMGGNLVVVSEPGKGARFSFSLCLPRAEPDPQASASEAISTMATAREEKQLTHLTRVLVAEDNPVNRRIVAKMLEPLDLNISFAETGEEALAACRNEVFDLILMDVSMPTMDGLTATRAIRSQSTFATPPRVPIVALTAHALESERQRALDAGVDDYLTKPVTQAALHQSVCHWDQQLRTQEGTRSDAP
ncbi:MAG: response regulator [Pseudomonadota bacterium]